MPLTIDSHRADEITVLACRGRIVEGDESALLQKHVNDLIDESPYVLLDLSGVDFIDSSGLGLLVRCMIRLENLHGILRVCAAPPRIAEAFRVTGLDTLFTMYAGQAQALTAFYDAQGGKRGLTPGATILCAEQSADLLAYIGQILRQAGYVVTTTTNLPDAMTLLTATRPKLMIIGSTLQALRASGGAPAFNARVAAMPVIELPAGFSKSDAGSAGIDLLDRVRTVMGSA
jgi:anti-anti-sigma factor